MDEFKGNSRFEIQRRLGAGGMGIVYKAYDRERKEVVALKTVRETDGEVIYRFKNEFRLLAGFVHPNFVSLYELFSTDSQIFFTMEFIDGVRFDEYVRDNRNRPAATSTISTVGTKPMSADFSERTWIQKSHADQIEVMSLNPLQLRRLRSLLPQLVTATCALHDSGFLHRDIKPSNVLIARNGRLVLLDFGLVTKQHQGEMSFSADHRIVGTALYMSPEQAAGLPVSTATDWYSVGVMLYECLVGRCPFEGNPYDIMAMKQRLDPPRPNSFGIPIPEDLESLSYQLVSRAPDARPRVDHIRSQLFMQPGLAKEPGRPDTTLSAVSPFLGRNVQWNALCEALASTRRGRPSAAFVHGKSGQGKTMLVRRFLDEVANDREIVILSGRCYEQENVPYKAFDSVVDALSRYLNALKDPEADALLPRDAVSLSRVFPVLRRVPSIANSLYRESTIPDQKELRQRAFAALRELLARLGDRKLLVLYIDDLQWGDLDSTKLLIELLRPPQPPVLLLVACYRSEDRESNSALQMLLDKSTIDAATVDIADIEVCPLSFEDSQRLSKQLLGSEDAVTETVAEAVARESAGNPYLIDALVRHYLATGNEKAKGMSIGLDDVLWARTCALPDSARRLMEVIAVAGYPIRQAEALEAAGVVNERHEALNSLRNARLIRAQGGEFQDRVDAYHDRVRESIIAHLTEERRKDCHYRLALALENSDFVSEPAAMGRHFWAAGDAERAGKYYATAAQRASDALAFDLATYYYRIALELGSWDEQTARQLRAKFAASLADAGRGMDAAHEYNAAAIGASAADALDLRRNAAMQSLICGNIDDGLAALRDVLSEVGMMIPRSPRRALFSLVIQRVRLRLRGFRFRCKKEHEISKDKQVRIDVSWSAAAGLSIVDTIRGAEFQAKCLLLALNAGDPYRISRALAVEAAHISALGWRAASRVERLFKVARELGKEDIYVNGLISVMSGLAAFLQGRWKVAVEESDRGEAILRENCSGVQWERNTAQGFALWALYHMGNIAEMKRRLPILLADARERGNNYALTNFGSFAEVLATLADDDPDLADANLRKLMTSWSKQGYHVQHVNSLYGRVQIELYRQNGKAAWQTLQDEWPALTRSLLLRVQELRIMLRHAYAKSALLVAANSNDRKAYINHVKYHMKAIERERAKWGMPLAKLIRAGIASLTGSITEAASLLRAASLEFDDVDMYMYAAAARRRLGELIGGDEGATLVQAADDWMASQGILNPVRMAALHAPGFRIISESR